MSFFHLLLSPIFRPQEGTAVRTLMCSAGRSSRDRRLGSGERTQRSEMIQQSVPRTPTNLPSHEGAGRCLSFILLRHQMVSVFILYLLSDESELLFGPATPSVVDQPSLHIY